MQTLNFTKLMNRQGLDQFKDYEAEVVDNNDPKQLGRVKARVAGIWDGIEDADLPWAIPKMIHPEGAFNDNDDVKRCGAFLVPKKKSKVCLSFPQRGDPHHPVYSSYTVDKQTMLPEAKTNYPDRAVMRFSNGMSIIIDTKTNEMFINNPGDLQMTILGSVNQNIVGNQMVRVLNSVDEVSGYLKNAPDKMLKGLKAKPAGKIPFEGILKKGKTGNSHTHIKGDKTEIIEGDRTIIVKGNDVLKVGRTSKVIGSQVSRLIKAARIDLN